MKEKLILKRSLNALARLVLVYLMVVSLTIAV
jgi:hypothetical protein